MAQTMSRFEAWGQFRERATGRGGFTPTRAVFDWPAELYMIADSNHAQDDRRGQLSAKY